MKQLVESFINNIMTMNFNKNTLYILVLALPLFIGFSGCSEERLEVEPVGEFLSSNFFVTEDQVFSGLVAAYDPLGWSMAYGQWISWVMFGEIRSDNANAGGDPSDNDQPGWQEFDDFRNTNTNIVTQPLYRRNYIGIFRANTILNQSNVESPAVDRYKAEAKFLRAFYHFELFKHFGPIAVIETLLSPEDINLERNTLSEVFESITSDLVEAVDVLPSTLSSSEIGRADKGAALALLGKAYLYWADFLNDDQAKFDLAAKYLQQVVDLDKYELEDDLQSLFNFNSKNTKESVFEIQHNSIHTSDWGWFEGIDGNGIVQLCGVRGLCSEHPTLEAGWGFMLVTPSLYNHFLDDDTYRRDVAITSEAELAMEIDTSGASCDVVVDLTQGNIIDHTGYWQEKYSNFKSHLGTNVNGGDPNLTKSNNTHPIRYADVLLMLAESLTRGTGSDGEAMAHIDVVRERAAGPGDNEGAFKTAQDIMSQEGWTLEELIQYERRAEFACEGDRWYDLVRTGRATADLFPDGDLRSGNFNVQQHLWLPLSFEETTVAPMLTTFPDESLFQ